MIRAVTAIAALAALAGPTPAQAAAGDDAPVPVVRVPFPQEDGTLTPTTFELGYGMVTLVYDTLTRSDAAGRVQPALAARVSRAGRRVVVVLRDGVRWHDGRALTAGDVVFTYRFFTRRGHPRFTPQLSDLASVAARDARTVVFSLRRPGLGFTDLPLADVPILPAHLWRRLPPTRRAPAGLPVGSGPYRLVEHRPGRLYRFRANRRWYAPVRVDEVVVPIVRTASAAIDALLSGRVDALPFTPAEPVRGPGIDVARSVSYAGTAVTFNTRARPFADRAVRRAVRDALDLDQIARGVGGDVIPAARGMVHPRAPLAGAPASPARPDLARVAIAELAVGPLVVLVADGDPLRIAVARQVVAALRRAGVRCELRTVWARRLDDAMRSGGFQLAVTAIPALVSRDPLFLRALFSGAGGLSRTGYASEALDRALADLAEASTQRERRAAARDALAVVERDVPLVPLMFPRAAYPYRAGVYDGWLPTLAGDLLDRASFVGDRGATDASGVRGPLDPVDRLDDETAGLPAAVLILAVVVLALALVALGVRGLRRRR